MLRAMHGNTYFDRHWRGELSLGVSYWVNNFLLGGIAYNLALYAISETERVTGEQPLACLGFVGAILVLLFGLQIWQVGGTWRSAARSRQYGRTVRATIVQTLLCFGVLGMIGMPIIKLLPVALAAASGRPVPIAGTVLRENGRVIDFSGPVINTSAVDFLRVLDRSRPMLVRLQSDGGMVAPARSIAAMIRRRGLDTEVSQRCVSACTIMFFAGRRRSLSGGTLGFHSYSSPQETPQALVREEQAERNTYLAGGVSPSFVERIFNVPPAKVWYPTREEIETAGFATPTSAR
jgi:hypothetical protein